MTIASEDRKAGPFPGDGVTVNFDFEFKVFAETDVLVIQAVTATGAETEKTITTDYTVTLNPNQESSPGGRVTMLVAPPAGQTITLTSEVPNLQGKTITSLGGFFPQVLNDALDRLTVLVQQVRRDVARSVKVNLSSTTTPDQLLADINNSVLAADASAAAAAGSAVAADASADAAAASAGSAATDLATAQAMLLAAKLGSGADIASAATLDLTARTGNIVRLTGAIPITALTMANGDLVLLVADGAAVFNVAGVLVYTCNPEDSVLLWQDGDGVKHAHVLPADGQPAFAVLTPKIANAAITAAKMSGAQTGAAPAFAIRGFAVFNGNTTGTNAPIAGGNCTSVTRNSAGNWTVNIATAMPAANFGAVAISNRSSGTGNDTGLSVTGTTTTTITVTNPGYDGVFRDNSLITVIWIG